LPGLLLAQNPDDLLLRKPNRLLVHPFLAMDSTDFRSKI
jgi:hypothetical protein